jgi:hypothetical protein
MGSWRKGESVSRKTRVEFSIRWAGDGRVKSGQLRKSIKENLVCDGSWANGIEVNGGECCEMLALPAWPRSHLLWSVLSQRACSSEFPIQNIEANDDE